MPKKKIEESQADQSKRFAKAVADLEAAGELNPIEANKRFERVMSKIASPATPKAE